MLLQSTVHERNFNMSFNEESWSYGGMKMNKPTLH